MTQPDYEYTGLISASWDLLRGDTSTWSDRFFYKDLMGDNGQPVLDVGCGTGRFLLDYMEQGIDIDGVDNSPEMLALCREKAERLGLKPNLYHQEMQALDLPRKYRTVMVPSSSFQLLTNPSDAKEAMRRFFNHLDPGGTLVMSLMLLWTGETSEDFFTYPDWMQTGEAVRPEDGLTVRRWSRSSFDIPGQLEHTDERYELLREGEIIHTERHTRAPGVRWYTQAQAIALYETAGFTDIRLLHDFTQNPAQPDDELFCVIGKKP